MPFRLLRNSRLLSRMCAVHSGSIRAMLNQCRSGGAEEAGNGAASTRGKGAAVAPTELCGSP